MRKCIKMKNTVKIWIDIDNSPHVPFFSPVIRELEKQGLVVTISARKFAQVVELANLHGLTFQVIGRHFGKNKFMKIIGMLIRALLLIPFIYRERPNLAVSHGSRSQLIAAGLMGIPTLEADDYEYSYRIPFFSPDHLLLPTPLFQKMAKNNAKGLIGYPGIKEDVYLSELKPDPSILSKLGIKSADLVVTVRPPATVAHYFNSKSANLFAACMDFLLENDNLRIIMLPRIAKQKKEILETWPYACKKRKIIIPTEAINGLNLIWHSDLVISGGGTMIREAAALHVPAYSIFGGKIGAVDEYLHRIGRLVLINNQSDLGQKLILHPRNKAAWNNKAPNPTLQFVVNTIKSLMQTNDGPGR